MLTIKKAQSLVAKYAPFRINITAVHNETLVVDGELYGIIESVKWRRCVGGVILNYRMWVIWMDGEPTHIVRRVATVMGERQPAVDWKLIL